jgi:hypothetical protein
LDTSSGKVDIGTSVRIGPTRLQRVAANQQLPDVIRGIVIEKEIARIIGFPWPVGIGGFRKKDNVFVYGYFGSCGYAHCRHQRS